MRDLVTHIDAICQFAAKDTDMLVFTVYVNRMLARQFQPVGLIVISFNGERSNAAALGDNILAGKGLLECKQAVDIIEDKFAILLCDGDLRVLNLGICCADTGFWSHGNNKKQSSIRGKKR